MRYWPSTIQGPWLFRRSCSCSWMQMREIKAMLLHFKPGKCVHIFFPLNSVKMVGIKYAEKLTRELINWPVFFSIRLPVFNWLGNHRMGFSVFFKMI
ncbi:hypothetical protein ERO13_A06G129100v2 [Gossypium hirsutum]|nr:hypothetical protein ERO13_A06G129100v2 [Gossypium hirsutum]